MISETGNLTKTGTGNLTLSGTNTYTGTTTISDGTLTLGASGVLSDSTAVTVGGSGTLDVDGNFDNVGSLAGSGSVDLGSGTLGAGSDNTSTTFSGVVSGTGGLNKNGTGTMTLSGANTYTGTTTINNGTLQLGANDVLSNSTTVSSSASGVLDLNDNSDTIGALVGDGSVTLGSGTLTTGGGASSTYSGVVSGTGGLTKEGASTFTLDGTNTYTGDTTVSAGTLALGADNVLADVTAVTVSGGATFDLDDNSDTVGSLAGAGDIDLGSGTLTTGGNDTSTAFSGDISGTGDLDKIGTGNQTLSGTNDFTGTTTVSEGTLTLDSTDTLSATSDIAIGDGTLALGANDAINSSADISIASTGVLDLGGNSQAVGDLTAADGSTLDFGTPGGANTFLFDTYTPPASGIFVVNNWEDGVDQLATTVATQDVSSVYLSGIGVAEQQVGLTALGGAYGSGYLLTPVSVTTKEWDGSKNQSWKSNNNWTSPGEPNSTQIALFDDLGEAQPLVNLNDSYTIAGIEFGSLGTANYVLRDRNSNGHVLTLDGAIPFIQQKNALDQSINNMILNLGNNTIADITGAGDLIIGATITEDVGDSNSLVRDGSGDGKLILSGDNTFSGGVFVTTGIVETQSDTGLGTGTATVADTGTLEISTDVTVANDIVTAGTGVGGNGAVRSISDDNTLTGVISGSGTVQVDAGSLTLSGSNTYTGETTVAGGTLIADNDNSLGSAAGGTTIDSGGVLSLTNDITIASEALNNNGLLENTSGSNEYGGVISGTGDVTTVAGDLTLSNTNSYSGDTTVGTGTMLTITADDALGTGSTTVDSGGTLALTGDITAGQTNFDLSGTGNSTAGAIQNVSGDNRLTGDFSLSAAATTQSDAGTLILGADPPSEDYATDTFDLGANALTIDGSGDTELNAGLSGSGNLVKDGTGTLTVNGVVDKTGTTAFTGEVTVNDGTMIQATLFNVAPGEVGYDDYGINNDITVGNGDATAATLTLGTNDAGSGTNFAHMIGDDVDLTVNSDGTFNTRGHATVLQDVTLDNGTINANKLAGGNEDALVIKGSISATNTSGDSTINGVIDFNQPGNPPASLTTVDVASGGTLDINARVQNGGISKTGDGTLELSGVNTYSGATNVTAGIVRVDQGTVGSNSGLGNEDGGTVVSSGAQLQLDGVTISGEALTLNGTGISSDGALQTVASTTNTWGGTVAIASTSEIEVSSGSSLTLSGVMSGSGQTLTIDGPGTSEISGEITSLSILNKTGSGQLTLSGDSKTIATTNVSEGTLTLGTSDILSDALDLNLSGTGTFTMGGGITETIDQLTVAGSSVLDVDGVLTLNGGTISGGDGSGSTGTMILSSGTVMTPNTLNITNDFDFGGTLELTADTVLAISGGHTFDLGTLNVTGDTVIDFTGADPNTFNLGTLNIAAGVTIDVIGWDSHFDLWTAANFIGASLDNRNGVTSQITFNGFSPAHTIWRTEDFGDFEITVPEPGTYGAVLMGMSLAAWMIRRPRRNNLSSD